MTHSDPIERLREWRGGLAAGEADDTGAIQQDTLNRVYVCELCLFGSREPRDHSYQYPRPGGVPGFHQHTAAMMSPFIRESA